ATTFDPISANNEDEHYATVICATSTLDIEKSGPEDARVGDLITYTVRVENNLGFDTEDNRMIDPIPGYLEYVSADNNICYEETQTNEVICGEFDLDDGDSIEFELTFKVLNTAICNRNIINIADVWSNHSGVNPEWSNAVSTKVLCDAVLVISKTDNRTTVSPGQSMLYEVLVTNTSSSDATTVTIVDTLPSNFVFSNASAGGVYNASSRTVTWVIDIDAFDTEILSVSGAANANAQSGNTLLNQVCIQNGACASDTTTVTGNQTPIFRIVKTDHRSTVKPGETLTYEIVVSNISNTDAPTVEVIDTLPQHVTFVSANGGGVFNNNGKVRWTGGLDANSSVILEVVVTVDATAPDNFFLLNQVEITGGPSDDDITKVVLDPIAEGCIDIKKETFTAEGTPLTPVTQFTFTLDGGTQTVLNNSLGNARFINVPVGNHTITETIPAGWTQENVTPAGGIVSVPAGSTCATVTFKNKQVAVGTAQFTISKTDNLATAEPGDTLTYRMEIRNISTIDATNVEVKDTVPDYTEFISASDGGSKNGNTVTWVFPIAAGATKSFEMRVNVEENADDGDVIFNQVRITDGPSATDTTRIEDDNDDNDDNDDDDTDIRVTINDDPDPIDICNDDDLEYEIRLTNSSNSNEEVDVIAIIDSDTDYQSSSDGGKEKSGDRVEWDNVKVNRNSNRTLRLRVRVESGARDGDTLRLRVGVSDGDEDTEVTRVRNNGCADDDDEGTPSTTTPDLTIDKTANTSEALAGSSVSYTITIRNTGGSDISDAILTDDYPEQYVDITDTGGGSDAGGRLTWNLGTLRSNSTTVVRYNVRLKPGVTRGTTIRNTATVRSGTITRTDDHVIVVPTPPQTGLGGFIKSLTQSESYLSEVNTETSTLVAVVPQQREVSATTLPLVIWITTMLTGLGMGGMFGRKFLF
ncbi:MAG: DUF11 domain-containing protein, partial [bacterium]|nr:DUF11 domain-containing protein [bacterium]